jgi:hypothetical protein
MKKSLLFLLALLIASGTVRGDWTFTVTNAQTAITAPDSGAFSILVRENSTTPSATFTIWPGAAPPAAGASGTVLAAGQSYIFTRSVGFPFLANQVVGYIQAGAAGPYTFAAIEYTSTSLNFTPGGDLGGTPASQVVLGIRGVPISATAPSNAQALIYNSAQNQYVPGSAGSVPVTTVSGLPAYTSQRFAIVTDGASATDCTTGSGSVTVACQYGGSSWTATASTGSAGLWSGLGNAGGNLALTNAGYTSTFNQTSAVNWSWANTTAATSGANQSSPIFNLKGTYYTGSASAVGGCSLQTVMGTGNNPTETLTVSCSGSSGAAALAAPALTLSTALSPAYGGLGLASITAYNLVVGNATAAANLIAPSSTSGVPLLSQGASANPAYAALNLAGGASIVTGTLPAGNLPNSGVTTISGVNCTIGGSCTMTSLNSVSYPSGASANTVPVVTSSNTVTYEQVPNAALANTATTVDGQTCTLGSSCTLTSLNGVGFGSSPTTNTVPVVTATNTTTYEQVPNAALVNASTTVSGQTCTLGGSCTIALGGVTATFSAPLSISTNTVSIAGATSNAPGTVQLTGDFGNTYTSPQVVSTHITGAVNTDLAVFNSTGGLGNYAGAACTGSQVVQTITASGGVTCLTPSGSGNVSASGSPTQYQIPAWVNGTAIEGIGPGTAGYPLISGGGSAYASFAVLGPAGGGLGITSPTAHGIVVPEGSSNFNVVSPPTANGLYFPVYNVTGNAAVDPTVWLAGMTCRNASGSTDTILYSDNVNCVEYSDNASVAVTLPTPTTLGNSNFATFLTIGGGASSAVTVTPTTWTVNGASSLGPLVRGQTCKLFVDAVASTNWLANCYEPLLTAGTGMSFTRTNYGLTLNNTGVTSVAFSAPTGFTVSGSPVTSTGTLTLGMPTGWISQDLLVGSGSGAVTRLPVGTNGQCLTVSTGAIVWGSCAAGGTVTTTGSPASGQGTFFSGTSTITGNSNWTYSASSGHSIVQGANSSDAVFISRFTDTSPTGYFLQTQNAAKTADIFDIDIAGHLIDVEGTCPSASSGYDILCASSSAHAFQISLNGGSFVSIPQLAGDLAGTAASPTVTNGSHITNSSIPNSGLVNTSVTFNGQAIALGSSANVNNGAAQYSVAINEAAGAAIQGVAVGAGQILQGAASANPSGTSTPTLGVQNTTQATLTLAGGSSSNPGQLILNLAGSNAYGVTLQNLSATAAYNWNFPATAGLSGNLLASGGGGSTGMSWFTTSGSGTVVALTTSPTFTTPNLGTPSTLVLTNATGLPNSGLVNTATTVNSQTCTLGSSCSVNSGAAQYSVALNGAPGAALGGATIGTAGRVLIDQGSGANPSFVAISQDCTLTSAGVITCTKTNNVAFTPFATATGAINPQTSTYQVLASDFSNYKSITVASGTFTITLVASTSQPSTGEYIDIINYGSGTVTVARSGQNINGGTTSLTLNPGSATSPSYALVESDGTNYEASVQQGLASPGAIGGTTAAAGTFTTLTANTSLVINSGTALTTTNQSGTGSLCMTTSCVMTTPNLGTPSAATLTNASGLPLSGLATQGANTVVMNNTASSASPTAVADATAFAALSPMTTLGDIIYENSTPAPARLAGYTTANAAVLTQTGTGSASAAPAWSNAPAISGANFTALPTTTTLYPTLNQSTTGNAATATALASYTGYSVYGSGASSGAWITPSANGQCLMSAASSYATTTPSFQTCPSGGTPALSSVTALAVNTSLSNANYTWTLNSAQTSNSQFAVSFLESTAATNGTGTAQGEFKVGTLSGSTSVPFTLSQGGLTGSQTVPAVNLAATWNTTGAPTLISAAVTNTASAAGSYLLNLLAGSSGTTSEFSVTVAGAVTAASSVATGTGSCTAGTAGALCLGTGSAPTAQSGYNQIWAGTSSSPVIQAQLGTAASGPMEAENVTTQTGTYSATLTDFYILCNSSSAFTVTLPVTSQTTGKTYRVKNINTGVCSVAAASGNVDNVASFPLNQWQSVDVMYSGSQYLIF